MSVNKAAVGQTIIVRRSAMAMFRINMFVGFDLNCLDLHIEYIITKFPTIPNKTIGATKDTLNRISSKSFLYQSFCNSEKLISSVLNSIILLKNSWLFELFSFALDTIWSKTRSSSTTVPDRCQLTALASAAIADWFVLYWCRWLFCWWWLWLEAWDEGEVDDGDNNGDGGDVEDGDGEVGWRRCRLACWWWWSGLSLATIKLLCSWRFWSANDEDCWCWLVFVCYRNDDNVELLFS